MKNPDTLVTLFITSLNFKNNKKESLENSTTYLSLLDLNLTVINMHQVG